MIINELGGCPTRSGNVYFANNEHNSVKLKLYNNWLEQAVNNISEFAIKN